MTNIILSRLNDIFPNWYERSQDPRSQKVMMRFHRKRHYGDSYYDQCVSGLDFQRIFEGISIDTFAEAMNVSRQTMMAFFNGKMFGHWEYVYAAQFILDEYGRWKDVHEAKMEAENAFDH